jgi:hypothetical protein
MPLKRSRPRNDDPQRRAIELIPGRRIDFLLLVLVGVLVRGAIALVYQPQTYPDTGTYVSLALRLRSLSILGYGGERTPGYPLLLIAANLNDDVVWLYQSILGIGTSLLTYWIVAAVTRNRVAALCAGLIHSLSLNQIFFESTLLTETLAAFLVVLSVFIFVNTTRLDSFAHPALLGLVSALATLTRPTYAVLSVIYCLLLLVGVDRWRAFRRVAAFSIVFLAPLVLWASVNKISTGQFTMTTLVGYSLSNHAGGFIELASDKYSTIRDIYLKYREERRATSPSRTHANTAIGAKAELLRETGLQPVELSRELAKMSLELFYHHPLLYAKSFFEAWVSFWAVPIYWDPNVITATRAKAVLESAWRVEHVLIRAANLAFVLLATVAGAMYVRQRRQWKPNDSVVLAVGGIVLASSILQALFEFGDNPRFGIPTQPLVMSFLAIAGVRIMNAIESRRRQPPEHLVKTDRSVSRE